MWRFSEGKHTPPVCYATPTQQAEALELEAGSAKHETQNYFRKTYSYVFRSESLRRYHLYQTPSVLEARLRQRRVALLRLGLILQPVLLAAAGPSTTQKACSRGPPWQCQVKEKPLLPPAPRKEHPPFQPSQRSKAVSRARVGGHR